MDNGVDERLRRALEPRPESVERIVRGALDGRRPARPSRLVPALAGAAALLALAALFLARPRPQAPVSIENVGEVLVVRHPGGRVLIHNGEAAESSPPSGSMIMIHGGPR